MDQNASRIVVSTLLIVGLSSAAYAQSIRTFVSGVGNDANPCSRTAPCKTFSGAFNKTATGGEINAIDPGGYGAVTITKSITLDGTGTQASILSPGTSGIIINTPANSVVNLRNLEINGAGTGTKGIRFIGQGSVNIEKVKIYGIGLASATDGRCIEITPSAASKVNIVDTTVTGCNGQAIFSAPTAGTTSVTLDRVYGYGNKFSGFDAAQNTAATLSNCFFTNNGGAGVFAELGSATVNVDNCTLSHNSAGGIVSGNGGAPTIRVGHSIITNNGSNGLQLNGGTIVSWGDNYIAGNAGNENPSSTILKK